MSRLQELIQKLCPDGVEYKALGELGSLQRGKRFVRNDFVEQGTPCIHYGELYTHYGVSTSKVISHVRDEIAPKLRYAQPGDVIIVGAGETVEDIGLGVAWLGDVPVAVHDACYTLHQDFLDPVFVSYFLRTDDFHSQIRKYIGSSKVSSVSSKGLAKALIPVPPIEVQREVVRILDEYTAAHDELVRQLEEEMGLLSKQRETALMELNDDLVSRGYPFEPLGDHADVLSGFPFKSSGYVDEGVPVCGGVSIMPGYVDWTTCRYWPSAENLDQFILNSGDIVMALDRPWVSSGFKLAQISEDDEGALLVQRTARVRGIDMIQPYIRALMEMNAFREHCAATGNTVPHVSHKKIESYMVPVPPIDEQEEYVRKAGGVSSITNAIVDTLNGEKAYLEQQLSLVRNQLLSFPEKVA